ncbi:MAG: hypothetical protein MUO99_03535, partial [Dehalococcoidales bacterium]|nr:hypothetical protein [Dehalococcoidales bacterium]
HLMASAGWWQGEETRIAEAVYSWNRPTISAPRPATTEFKAGDHVRHAQFGNGIIVSYKTVKDDVEVAVAFNSGVKKLLLSFASLEKVE